MYLILLLIALSNAFQPRIVLLPGYGCNKNDYKDIVNNCKKKSISVDVVPIERWNWLYLCKGFFNANYWNRRMRPDELFDWYLDKAKNTVEKSVQKNNGKPIVLCGHSAGGWLGRALMQNGTFYKTHNQTSRYVRSLVTMGTPNIIHKDPKYDTTRGCLHYINKHYPGSFLEKEDITYITIGSYAKPIIFDTMNHFSKDRFVYNSYKTVLGNPKNYIIYGDGIVPLQASHLENAIQLTYNDVFHFKRHKKRWYGSESVLNDWLSFL